MKSERLEVTLRYGHFLPRTFSVSFRFLRWFFLSYSFLIFIILTLGAFLIRDHFFANINGSHFLSKGTSSDPDRTTPDKNSDTIQRLESRLQQAQAALAQQGGNSLLSVLPSHLKDFTKTQDTLKTQNFSFQSSAFPSLSFELVATRSLQEAERGFIIVLLKTPSGLFSYPANSLGTSGPFLVDISRGETFQVARLRFVKAEFPQAHLMPGEPIAFQVLIVRRNGDVLFNLYVEPKKKETSGTIQPSAAEPSHPAVEAPTHLKSQAQPNNASIPQTPRQMPRGKRPRRGIEPSVSSSVINESVSTTAPVSPVPVNPTSNPVESLPTTTTPSSTATPETQP